MAGGIYSDARLTMAKLRPCTKLGATPGDTNHMLWECEANALMRAALMTCAPPSAQPPPTCGAAATSPETQRRGPCGRTSSCSKRLATGAMPSPCQRAAALADGACPHTGPTAGRLVSSFCPRAPCGRPRRRSWQRLTTDPYHCRRVRRSRRRSRSRQRHVKLPLGVRSGIAHKDLYQMPIVGIVCLRPEV